MFDILPKELNAVHKFLKVAPFGGEDEDPPPAGQQQQQSPENKPPENKPPENQPENKDDPDEDEDDEYSGYSAKELRRIAKDLSSGKKAAEKDRDGFKSKVDEQERSKRSDLENLQSDNDTLKSENTTLRTTNAKLAIVNAIICDTKYNWHNPEIVAQQLNSEVVKVTDDGKVEGLSNELKRIAKDHAYLLKENQQQQQNNNQQPSGMQPGQGGATSGANLPPNAAELAKTYPALASRLPVTSH